MKTAQKPYVTPAIETLDSGEILELIGPVQGYGAGSSVGSGLGVLDVVSPGSSGSTDISR